MSDSTPRRADVRNIAIIAHVDHGKTTLVDALLRQSGEFREGTLGSDLVLDSNDLERERGITILSKNISLPHRAKDGSTVRVNIIDTPGHADFGGEVERVLRMADGALILVDAFEGPRPQTRFVVGKALEVGLKPIVVVNKIDRPNARPEEVLSETFDLFAELGADDETLDFPYLFASGMQGYASEDPECREGTIAPILDAVIEHIPGPAIDPDGPPAVMVTSLTYSEYVGRVATGRIVSGRFKPNQRVVLTRADGSLTPAQITQVELFDKLGRVAVEEATAGDIVALTGLPDPQIGDTVTDPDRPVTIPRLAVDEPTLSMLFTINSSPMAGREGKYVTSRNLRDRLMRELQANVALRVEETGDKDSFAVAGRGVLHLSILIETMRREGYELSVGAPRVIDKEVDGKRHEPFEHLVIDVPAEGVGGVMTLVGDKKGQLTEMSAGAGGMTHLEFQIPARG